MLADVLPFNFALDPTRASLAGQRSGQVRRERSFHAKTFDKPPTVDKVQVELNAQAKIVKQEIANTVKMLNDENHDFCDKCKRFGVSPNERAQLNKSLDTMLNRQRVLLNVPDPGTERPRNRNPRDRNQPSLAPRAATPQPIDNSGVSTVQEPVPDPLPVHLYHMT